MGKAAGVGSRQIIVLIHPFVIGQHAQIDQAHIGVAIAAQNPRSDLRELAIQTVNVHFQSGYSFNTRRKVVDQLFVRTKEAFGEKSVVEMTSVIGFWSFWAMFLDATYN